MGQENHTTNTSYPDEGPSVFGESSFERSETPSDNIRCNYTGCIKKKFAVGKFSPN